MKKYLLCLPLLMAACSLSGNNNHQSTTKSLGGQEKSAPTFSEKYDDVPGMILVDAVDNISEQDIAELERIAGTSFAENNDTAHKYKYEVGFVDPVKEDSILSLLQADNRVEHAERMVKYYASYVPNDPMYKADQWHMTRVGAESSWNMSCGMGVTVAVVDTGVSCKTLTDLAGTKCDGGFNFVDNNDVTADDQSHGSHVAGTIAQTTNNGIGGAGLAPCVTIMPVKVLSSTGSGTMEGVAEGIRFAADHGADVINLSLGGPPSGITKDAVDYAYSKGVVVVAAAGNSSGRVGYPAAYPHVIAVSATTPKDTMADFSCFGPEISIGAPGVDVMQQTIGRGDPSTSVFAKFNGTSMATPHVAGAAALVVGTGITDPDAVKEKLQDTADPKKNKNQFGAGILRADSAVQSAFMSHAFWRLLALFGLIAILAWQKVDKAKIKTKMSLLGVVLGGFGFLPLIFTGLLPRMGSFRWVGELLIRPIGEWDIIMGLSHNYLVFANFLPALLATVLMYSNRHLRNLAGGFSLGLAALCAQMVYSGDVNFFLGSFVMKVWLVANVAVCAALAHANFTHDKK